MFKQLFSLYKNTLDTPSILFKLNLWSYINIRIFKFKISRALIYFISVFDSLKLKKINIFFKDWDFNYFYFRYFYIFLYLLVFLIIIC